MLKLDFRPEAAPIAKSVVEFEFELKASRNSQIIEKRIVCVLSLIIDELIRFYSSIIESIWEASIVVKSFVEFQFEY